MNLRLQRYSDNGESTLGLMFLDGEFFCHTLEGTRRDVKVAGETRIPAGYYRIKFRDVGGMTKKYAKRFPDMHRGMLWLQDVKDFNWVYIHVGNKKEHTEGCVLVGDSVNNNNVESGFVSASTLAYRRLYALVMPAIMSGKSVFIRVLDERE